MTLMHRISPTITAAQRSHSDHLGGFYTRSSYRRRTGQPGVVDLVFGDPHEVAAPALVECMKKGIEPKHAGWFAYTQNEPSAQAAIAKSLSCELETSVQPEDIALTNGAFGGLMVCLRTVCAPGDEVIYVTPSWFFYEAMILSIGAVPRAVSCRQGTWDLDLERIEQAITAKTSAIIVNSPNNPTGVIYTPEQLSALGALLARAQEKFGRPIYLLSDEAYRKIVFEDANFTSPVLYHPFSFLIQTYTKTLLIPGERVGYIALGPRMPDRKRMREVLEISQRMTGWAYPNASLQYGIPELETMRLPLAPIQRRRDRLLSALRRIGYEVGPCHGTFYLLVRVPSPSGNDWQFAETLAERGVLVLPGSVMRADGFFRISLTVSDEEVALAIPGFKAAWRHVCRRTFRDESSASPA